MTVNELIGELEVARDLGMGEERVGIIHASSGEECHKHSGVFHLIGLDADHGVNLIERRYISRYIPAVFKDEG